MWSEILLDRKQNRAQLTHYLGTSSRSEASAQPGGRTSNTCSAVFKQTWEQPWPGAEPEDSTHLEISVQLLEHNPEENTLAADGKPGTELLSSAQAAYMTRENLDATTATE